MKVLAFAISILFHPLLLPLYVLFITFNTGTVFTYIPAYTQNMSYLLTLLGVTLIPLLCLPLLKWLGLIEGYRLVQKQDRVLFRSGTVIVAHPQDKLPDRHRQPGRKHQRHRKSGDKIPLDQLLLMADQDHCEKQQIE